MKTTRFCQHCHKPLANQAIEGLCPECLMKMGLGIGTEASFPAGRPSFDPPSVVELATHFPQFEILAFVGQGGMGAVYQARQKQLDRTVALKILPPDIGNKPGFAERFTREAKAMARLNHPGIVTIHDFGQVQGFGQAPAPDPGAPPAPLYYLVMEFVDGVSLRQLLRSGRVSPREALAIVPQICDALQYAHDQGIVHRDIKPENILLDRLGRVKVADFGLAKLVGRDVPTENTSSVPEKAPDQDANPEGRYNLTEADRVMGTPHYMAPEQAAHPATVDHRADIYALGVVLYQMLTGELPGHPLEPPSKKVSLDVRLDNVVLRALDDQPERRYQHVGDVKTDIETITRHAPATPRASTTGLPGRSRPGLKRPILVGTSVGFSLLLFIACLHLAAAGCSRTPHDQRVMTRATDDQLATKVTLTKPYPQSYQGAETDRITVQYAMIELAKQAKLGYDWGASQTNAGEVCRKFITPEIEALPLREALTNILEPEALTYDIRNGKIVLKKN